MLHLLKSYWLFNIQFKIDNVLTTTFLGVSKKKENRLPMLNSLLGTPTVYGT